MRTTYQYEIVAMLMQNKVGLNFFHSLWDSPTNNADYCLALWQSVDKEIIFKKENNNRLLISSLSIEQQHEQNSTEGWGSNPGDSNSIRKNQNSVNLDFTPLLLLHSLLVLWVHQTQKKIK